jgi:hypothetical protein
VKILDDTQTCPFCKCVLETENTERVSMYPDARITVRRFRFFENLVLFLSIVAESTMLVIDYMTDARIGWSLIAALILFYGNVVLRLAIVGKSGYQFKIVSLVVVAIAVMVGIDYLAGYRGWSINYVFPAAVLLMDLGIGILMIVNRRNWQSYMMTQILTILMSLIPVILLAVGIVTFPYVALIAFGVSVFLFLGTLIMGDRRAKTELKRRFHI